jgi:rhodanese-related sulfurtransferase
VGDRRSKEALFDAFADVGKALGNGRRAELIDVLVQGERHVDELADEIGQTVANTSFHLRVLATAGLVTTRRSGTRIYYRVASGQVADLWVALRTVAAEHHEQLQALAAAYLGDRSRLEQISRVELAARIATGDVVVVDVRPTAEYEAGHIAGAVSMPIDDLAARVDALPPDVDVVAYCRGPYCVFADDAVRFLGRRGRAAKRLEDGFPEWRRAALPVTVGRGDDPAVAPPRTETGIGTRRD